MAVLSQPNRIIAVLVVVVGCALTLSGAAVARSAPSLDSALLATLLAAAGITHTEVATGVERARRRVAEKSFTDLSTIWTFTATLLLPAGLAVASVAAIYAHLWFRVWRPARLPLFRHVFTTSTVLLAVLAANGVVATTGGPPQWTAGLSGIGAFVLAGLSYAAVNYLLVALVVAVYDPGSTLIDMFGHLDEIAVELATLCLGAMLAIALTASWWFVALAFAPILVLQRAVLVRELAVAARTDSKTGLLTSAAWNARAVDALARARREDSSLAMLVLDLDHFKKVNDTHGHIAGDRVLAAVAGAVRAEVRGDDLVGRFGGEEFVVLLPGLPSEHAGTELRAVAERIRLRVAGLSVLVETADGPLTISGLSISAGGALVPPAPGTTVEQAIGLADRALYAAKASGRNRVRIAGAEPGPSGHAAELPER